jgi:hypothetical protein
VRQPDHFPEGMGRWIAREMVLKIFFSFSSHRVKFYTVCCLCSLLAFIVVVVCLFSCLFAPLSGFHSHVQVRSPSSVT